MKYFMQHSLLLAEREVFVKLKSGMLFIFYTTTFLTIISCVPVPGGPGFISEDVSEFDGTTQIKMVPAQIDDSGTGVRLGLFHNTKMRPNSIVLTAVVSGVHRFSDGKSLHFNIDGDVVSYASIDSSTDFSTSSGFVGSGIYIPPSNWSSKDYLVDKDFVVRITQAERVIVKVDLKKTFVEGPLSGDSLFIAMPAFKEFLLKMETLKGDR